MRRYDMGVLFKRVDKKEIADTINSLSRDAIDVYKHRSLAAARELCWEKEAEQMLAAYDAVAVAG